MTSFEFELVIDFGNVGYRQAQSPFRVRLKADALWALFRDVLAAHRVYELLLIERPGDAWDYVSVLIEEAPAAVLNRVARLRSETERTQGETRSTQRTEVPFNEFDQLFYWAGDDTEPEDEAWLSGKDRPAVRAFAQQLLAAVGAARDRLAWNDPLARCALERVRANEHPYAYLPRGLAIRRGQEHAPNPPIHSEAFYKHLERLLRDPELVSVAYRADGDHRVLRAMASEQRRRATATGHEPGVALHLSALCNQRISNDDWGSEIWFFEEGLGHGDLFIDGGGLGGAPIKALVQRHGRVPGRCILSVVDEGDINGFEREAGDGFVLYRKQAPDRRRVALEKIESRRSRELGPVLTFDGTGSTLFDYDKAVVLVGESISAKARSTLAKILAEWQQHRGDPALLVFGDRRPFELAGCRLMQDRAAEGATSAWIRGALRTARPWMDALIALDPPSWSTEAIAALVEDQTSPWAPWVVTYGDTGALQSHYVIGRDLDEVLLQASARARSMRPQQL